MPVIPWTARYTLDLREVQRQRPLQAREGCWMRLDCGAEGLPVPPLGE
jgi:hypothetical protein